MVSDSVKSLYNTYLATTRSCQNKPFKLRQDFSNFYETEAFVSIKKVQRFLSQHPEIDPNTFFKAPYLLHPGEVFDLPFYCTLAAVKKYLTYMNTQYGLPYDDIFHLNWIKQGLKFIKSFCEDKKISVTNYCIFSGNDLYPDWFIHIKNKQISPLIMYGFSNTRQVLESVEQDMISLLIPTFHKDFYSNAMKFKNSNKAKILVERGLNLIERK